MESEARLLQEWFDRNSPPTAILALTNFLTLTVLTTIAERGLGLPRDISLIGFDDYAWMHARATPLTAIAQPVREMGRILWERLSARIKGDESPARHILLPCQLVLRASTAPPPKRGGSNKGAARAARSRPGSKTVEVSGIHDREPMQSRRIS